MATPRPALRLISSRPSRRRPSARHRSFGALAAQVCRTGTFRCCVILARPGLPTPCSRGAPSPPGDAPRGHITEAGALTSVLPGVSILHSRTSTSLHRLRKR
jgi:hypothetical protein